MQTLLEQAQQLLLNIFGYNTFRPLQENIICDVLSKKDCFVLMPTGGGKSLCFQIPALIFEGITIVISPLISLMQDQVQALNANGVSAYYLNSSLSYEQNNEVLKKLHANEIKLLYVAPEKILSSGFINILKNIDISLFAIDEVHCVSQWGPDFRKEYQKLSELRVLFPEVPVIALTATADTVTRNDIIHHLKLEQAKLHISSFDRANIEYYVEEKQNPRKQIQTFLKSQKGSSGVIYCFSRKRVEALAEIVNDMGFCAKAYHAGLESRVRQQVQEAFQKDEVEIVVATIAFGMGIDKSNVRFVIHFDIPKSIENFYQETGRAGRDGLPAKTLLLYGLQDVMQMKRLIESTADENLKRIEQQKFNSMIQFAEGQACRRKILLNYFNEPYIKACNNCDICHNPPQMYDASIHAQKVLSCIYRLNQSFGAAYVVDVLRGSENKRLKQFGHHKLSTYGIGQDISKQQWFSIIRQLIHRDIIRQDLCNFSVLKLTKAARPILTGNEQLFLAKAKIEAPKVQDKPKKLSKAQLVSHENYDPELFEHLRNLRRKLAQKNQVAPFIIFSDAALLDMVNKKPDTKEAFLNVSGVGQKKLESFGSDFIEAIRDYHS